MSDIDNINIEFETMDHYLDEIRQSLWKIAIILSLTKVPSHRQDIKDKLETIEEMVDEVNEIITDIINTNNYNELI